MKIFVVPATYNEKDNIEEFITILEEEVFPEIKNHEMHIIVADDNSPDGTGEIVKKLIKKYKNLGINQAERKGLGAAYLRTMGDAIENLGADVVVSIDADFQFNPHDLLKYIEKLNEGYDVVVQTRYSGGGSIPENWPPQRKIFSIAANLFVRTVFMKFAIHDWTGGFRAIKKEVFLKEKREMQGYNGYIFQIAFLHKAVRDGFKVGEVPLHFSDRKLGNSKIAPVNYIISVLKFVITTRIKELIYGSFGKFLVVGGVGFIINAMMLRFLVESFGVIPAVANLTGAAIAIFSNYNFNNLWTFSNQKRNNLTSYVRGIFKFYLTSAFGVIVIQTGTIALGDILFGRQWYFIYFIIGTGFLLFWNFTIYNRFIWRKKPLK
ncbi:MAG: glycosyltransferase [Candidatus Levybacteria bacterium]|nr:glycosyltransferase [Candidatus Levybacteria bacterium]